MTVESEEQAFDDQTQLVGKRVAFVGKLGGVNRRTAHRLVRQHGGIPVDRCQLPLDLVVLGADELPLVDETVIDETVHEAAARNVVEIISETQFWHRLGYVDNDQHVRRLYTPAMLAELLGVSVSVIRRWHRRGLIVPAREVHRLPYFDFQEVATARRLAELIAGGATPDTIERQLAQLARLVPDVERPLAQLSVIVEGRELLLRQGEGLVEPGGQMRIDFPDDVAVSTSDPPLLDESVIAAADLFARPANELPNFDELIEQAGTLEDGGHLREAAEVYRVALATAGPRPECCFRLANLLYRLGDLTAARERYSMTIELDEDYVEARANLACVLVETGEIELAIAAFQGALKSHPDYPDVHYHLARVLDEIKQSAEAEHHWRRFLELAPDSPWADEARMRLNEAVEFDDGL